MAELAQMSSAELHSWQAYAAIEPFGTHYDDLRAGTVAAAIYNVHRDTKKRPEPFKELDFVPWNDAAQQAALPLQLPTAAAEADALAAAFGVNAAGGTEDGGRSWSIVHLPEVQEP